MQSADFQNLINKRKDWVKISRENNFDFDCILAGLYNDPSHFIYEILQNAEDAEAKEVFFELHSDKLDIYHDGKDFDFRDIEGVTGVGISTKKDDIKAIGKFGVGFKSVFAVTQTPIIRSGDYHIKIDEFVVPSEIKSAEKINRTKISLPFNHKIRNKNEVFELVSNKLENIGSKSLLFLKNINEVKWETPSKSGHYIKHPEDFKNIKRARKVTVLTKTGDIEEYCVTEKQFEIGGKALKIEVAFKIGKDKNGREIILPETDSKLVVFFPTEKVTFLKFLIQGPYKTTPNRENIPLDDEQNKIIIEKTAELTAESISIIKDLGYLNTDFLNILPINSIHVENNPIYKAIYEQVKARFLSDDELLPTSDGRFTKASDALLARGKDLTEMLSKEDIKHLFSKRNWLSTDITDDPTQDLRNYLINELKIKEIDFEGFARNITSDFLETKSDEWMTEFYSRLLGQPRLWKDTKGILRTKPIIRLDNNSHIPPYDKDGKIQVYLPTETKSIYKTVKKAFVGNEESLKFLKELGLMHPDIFAEIKEFIIPKYQGDKPNIDENECLEHFEKLLRAFDESSDKKQKELISQLSEIPFVRATNYITNEDIFAKPTEVYLDNEELRQYFEVGKAYFVSDSLYQKFGANKLNAFLKAVGVEDKPRRKTEESHYGNRGEYTKDFEYDGLSDNLRLISKNRSLLIWKMLLKSIESLNTRQAERFFEREECKKYYTLYTVYSAAKFLKTLQENAWLYDENGEVKKPSEITFFEISDEYEKDNPNVKILKEKLQFEPDVYDQLPKDSKSKLEIVKDYSPEELKEALTLLDRKRSEDSMETNGEESWKPECQPEDIKEVVPEIVIPEPYKSPDLEGQSEHLKTVDMSDDGKSEEEKDKTEKDSTKITTKQKKEIGNWGESFVLQGLKNQYKKLGVIEDTDDGFCLKDERNNTIEVFWLNIKSDTGKGCDFVVKKDGEEVEYIEVKTKLGEEEALIEITGTQWEFARKLFDQGEGHKYWVYVVVNAGKDNAKIKKLQNPISLWKDGKLYAHPIHFKL